MRTGTTEVVKFRRAVEIVATNVVLLLLLYFVTADQTERAAYASKEGLAFLFSRSILVQTSVLQGSRGAVQSPLTLDWIQLLVGALVIIDFLFAYEWAERRRKARPSAV